MKRIATLAMLWCLLGIISLAPLGCATSKRITVATIVTVHQAMLAWRDHVAAGYATPADEDRVRAAYGNYQNAVRVAKAAFLEADQNPGVPVDFDAVLRQITATSEPLISLVVGILNTKGAR